jgi:hypothetical protein
MKIPQLTGMCSIVVDVVVVVVVVAVDVVVVVTDIHDFCTYSTTYSHTYPFLMVAEQ